MEAISKAEFVAYAKEQGAYDVRVADPRKGFEHAVKGRHPLEILPTCRSVIVLAVPCPAWVNNTVLGLWGKEEKTTGRSALGPLRDAAYSAHHNLHVLKGVIGGHIWYSSAYYLMKRGWQVADFLNRAARPQDKLSAYEAGLGVYGRSGLLLHPELGNRWSPGVLLTDLEVEPDGRLEGYAPCDKCGGACIKACPGEAIDPHRTYPEGFTNKKCHTARAALHKLKVYCHECLRVCPAAKIGDEELAFLRRLYSHGERKRHGLKPGGDPTEFFEDITPA